MSVRAADVFFTLPELDLDGSGFLNRLQRLAGGFRSFTDVPEEVLGDFFVFFVRDATAVGSPFFRNLFTRFFGEEFDEYFVQHFVRLEFAFGLGRHDDAARDFHGDRTARECGEFGAGFGAQVVTVFVFFFFQYFF